MTYFISILLHMADPTTPPTVLYDTFPTMEACLKYEELLDNDATIKDIEKKGNIKSWTFCTDSVEPISEEESDSKPTTNARPLS